ncbi:hypothetical protein GCK72_013079 [Caenorhabditis remanei]|uniref:Uncharacterized protein n=1 Tax=Caenorhabditis remanei TaxID=31234 RepID=E3N800_CAERE|nr:hypothetical protein GCK72_013079 [Caenorhabditis remanei]EFO89264.1 hypothetical protein CRE_16304 [Caenorhabditis remanei]KAF1756625.1 hypothetical protein GCK72_013079 [Caenorhabditis remanei]
MDANALFMSLPSIHFPSETLVQSSSSDSSSSPTAKKKKKEVILSKKTPPASSSSSSSSDASDADTPTSKKMKNGQQPASKEKKEEPVSIENVPEGLRKLGFPEKFVSRNCEKKWIKKAMSQLRDTVPMSPRGISDLSVTDGIDLYTYLGYNKISNTKSWME